MTTKNKFIFVQNPAEKLFEIRSIINLIGSLSGLAVLQKNYKMNVLTYSLLVLTVIMVSFTIYTLIHYMDNVFLQMETICVYGVTISAMKKLHIVLKTQRQFYYLFAFAEEICEKNPKGTRADIIKQCYDDKMKVAKIALCIVIFSLMVYLAHPSYTFFFNNERNLLFNVLVPGLDHTSLYGYIFISLLHILCSALLISGSVAFDFYFYIMIGNYTMCIELLDYSLQELGEMWEHNKRSIKYRRAYLRNIIISFQDVDRYMENLNELVHPITMVQITALSLSLAVCLFCIMINKWIGGYGYLMFALGQFLLLSYLGTIVQIGNAKKSNIVYKCTWYNFPVEDQKHILLLLQRTQSAVELWVGFFAPLNFETAKEILRSIYQVFMMMLQYIE